MPPVANQHNEEVQDFRESPNEQPELTPPGDDDDNGNEPEPDNSGDDDNARALEDMTARAEKLQGQVDTLKRDLFLARVESDGRLIDPSDLAYSPELVEDRDALESAISDLIIRKPGLARVQYRGDIGAGLGQSERKAPVDLIGLLNAAL